MSWTVRDSIRGRRITLTYNAAQLPLAAAGSRWQRTREVLRHLKRSRSKHVLAVAAVDGAIETWWSAAEGGTSFAAAIDHWIESRLAGSGEADEAPPERFLVVIPLDERIYLAEIQQGLVREERALFPSAAEEYLERYNADGSVIHGFAAGTCTALPEQYVRLETPPFDLLRFEFSRPAGLFLRKGLPHPRHGLALAGAVLLAAVLQFGYGFLKTGWPGLGGWLGDDAQSLLPAVALQQVVDPSVPHSAGAELRALAGLIVDAEPLHADGLVRLDFGHGRAATYAGLKRTGWPQTARALAAALKADWRLDQAGWKLSVTPPDIDSGRRRPAATEPVTEALLRHPLRLRLVDGPRRSGGFQQSANILVRAVDLSIFEAEPESLSAQDLLDAADRLDGLPVSLASAACTFESFRLKTCSLTFEARTL